MNWKEQTAFSEHSLRGSVPFNRNSPRCISAVEQSRVALLD
jgi:hypothetical protein